MTPNQEKVRLWYTALKSGQYQQGKEQLRIPGPPGSPDSFCCWGVACDLHMQEDSRLYWGHSGRAYLGGADDTGSLVMPPVATHDWLGIGGNDPVHLPPGFESPFDSHVITTLANLNDAGYTLDQIADVIWYNYGEGDPPNVR